MSIDTRRLRLEPCAPEFIVTLIEDPGRFAQVAGFEAADGLRE